MPDYVLDEVALWLERGAGLAEVESELIDATPGLTEDHRAALWLFAWSYRPRERVRRARARRSLAR